MLITALFAVAFAGQDVGNVPPATPTYYLEGPLNFCAEEFSARLQRGEGMEWIAPAPGRFRYTIKSGGTSAVVMRSIGHPLPTAAETTALSLPMSPISRRLVFAMPEWTVMNREGETYSLQLFGIEYFLFGVAANDRPLTVTIYEQDQHSEIPLAGRIDPRPLSARRCRLTRFDPALARRIMHYPGR
jgi:hypothetical protein